MTRVGNKVVFCADDLQGAGPELWISDGTTKGTVLLKDINPNGGSQPQGLTRVGDNVYFMANGGSSARSSSSLPTCAYIAFSNGVLSVFGQ